MRGGVVLPNLRVLPACGPLAAAHCCPPRPFRPQRLLPCTPPPRPQVTLQKLDPKIRVPPRGDARVGLWQPRAASLPAHRLGIAAMAAGPAFLVTAGAGGSVKLTPEGALRALAVGAGMRLPE